MSIYDPIFDKIGKIDLVSEKFFYNLIFFIGVKAIEVPPILGRKYTFDKYIGLKVGCCGFNFHFCCLFIN